MTLEAYIQGIKDRIRDVEGRLETREWQECLLEAMAQYDRAHPLELTVALLGEDTDALALPDEWEDEHAVLQIECDLEGVIARRYLRIEGASVRRTDGRRFLVDGVYTLVYTPPRTIADVGGIPSPHNGPVTDLAAAKAARRLAAVYMKLKDMGIGAEIINFQRKWEEHLRLADVYDTQYSQAIYGTEHVSDSGALPIASGFGTWHLPRL